MAHKNVNKKHIAVQKKKPVKKNYQPEKSFQIPAWAIYAVMVFTALIYVRALSNGSANFDDDYYLFKNAHIKTFDFEAIKSIFSSFYFSNYHPLTSLTYLIEHQLYGLNPMPYHLFNVILHLLNTLLVYKLIEKLSGKKLTALLVSALFAVHPMHVESVAWIAERKDVLYTLFYLSALLVYLNYINSKSKIKYYLICLLLFVLSLLSKSAAVTLPVLMLAVDLYKNRKLSAKMFLEKLPFFALSILFGVLAIVSQETAMKVLPTTFTFFERIFLFSYTLVFYVVKLIAPFHLSAMHYYPDSATGILPWYYYASLPALILIAWLVIRKTSIRRENIFGICFFLITISVMLQVISVGNAIVAERYTYVSYIGLFYIGGQWISNIRKESLKKTMLFFSVFILMLFSFLTWERIGTWKDGIVLFTDVIKKYPDHSDGYYTRGGFKENLKDYQGALRDYNKCIQMSPMHAYCLNSRGLLLFKMNDFQQALRDYNNSILSNPEYDQVYKNRSAVKAVLGNPREALADINKAISMNPEDAESFSTRANIRAMLNDFSGANEDYSLALNKNPKDTTALYNRGLTRFNSKDTAGACEDWRKASELGSNAAGKVCNDLCK